MTFENAFPIWDHCGGKRWTPQMNWIRRLLEAGDEQGLQSIFASPTDGTRSADNRVRRAVRFGVAGGFSIEQGQLDRQRGRVTITINTPTDGS